MNSALPPFALAPRASHPPHPPHALARPTRPHALPLAGAAVALGCATQALFWNAPLGLDWLIWDVVMVGVMGLTVGPSRARAAAPTAASHRLRPIALGLAVVCVCFGLAIVWRRSAFTAAVAFPANLVALALLPLALQRDVPFHEASALPAKLLGLVVRAPDAIVSTALLPADAVAQLEGGGRHVVKRAALGVALGAPVAAGFALLLAADAGFAAALGRAVDRLGVVASFAMWGALTAVAYAFAHALYAEPPTPSAPATASAPPIDLAYRGAPPVVHDAAQPSAVDPAGAGADVFVAAEPAPRVSPLTWGFVIAQVAAVFGLFVAVRADTQFGGHQLVRARGALTYASYLHAGFYQLLLATVLSVSLVLVGHRLLRPSGSRVSAGGAALSALEGALLLLTGVTLWSCARRLGLYQEAYGATHLRLGVAFVCVAVAVVLACALGKAVFRGWRAFASVTAVALTAVTLVASGFDADGYVARANLDRASRGAGLDEVYLGSLTADACVTLEHPRLLADPELRARLLERWAREADSDASSGFRGYRGFGVRGFAGLGALGTRHGACALERVDSR
jgi:hypothetical protein